MKSLRFLAKAGFGFLTGTQQLRERNKKEEHSRFKIC